MLFIVKFQEILYSCEYQLSGYVWQIEMRCTVSNVLCYLSRAWITLLPYIDVRIVMAGRTIASSGNNGLWWNNTDGITPRLNMDCCNSESNEICHMKATTQAIIRVMVTIGFMVVGISSCRGNICGFCYFPGSIIADWCIVLDWIYN